MPNSGYSALMPPSGSVTPISRIEPQAATTTSEHTHAPTRQDGSFNRASGPPKLPSASETMNRATRVPASMVVRMNSASNMIAKWYQNDFMLSPPRNWWNTSEMPTASVGAPPVGEMIVCSPTSSAAWEKVSAVAGAPARPSELVYSAACSGVPPVSDSGAFMPKYRCWSMMQAVMMAMTATNDSISMPP